MAEAEANPSLGGYDDDFVSESKLKTNCNVQFVGYHWKTLFWRNVWSDFAETAFTVILQV